MAEIPARLVEVASYFGAGYKPILDFHGWRVAVLRQMDSTTAAAFHHVERHRETNEVFILTAGAADLIICDGDWPVGDSHVFPMERNVAYNIAQAVWHDVVMSPDAHIILFERTNTGAKNSDFAELPAEQIAAIKGQFTVG